VSSLMMGFAWGTGALMVPIVGLMADRLGLAGALVVVAFAPIIAFIVAFGLPDTSRGAGSTGSTGSTSSEGSDDSAVAISVGSGAVSP